MKKFFRPNKYIIRAGKFCIFSLGLLFILTMISLYLKLTNSDSFVSFYAGVNNVSILLFVVLMALIILGVVFNIIFDKIQKG